MRAGRLYAGDEGIGHRFSNGTVASLLAFWTRDPDSATTFAALHVVPASVFLIPHASVKIKTATHSYRCLYFYAGRLELEP